MSENALFIIIGNPCFIFLVHTKRFFIILAFKYCFAIGLLPSGQIPEAYRILLTLTLKILSNKYLWMSDLVFVAFSLLFLIRHLSVRGGVFRYLPPLTIFFGDSNPNAFYLAWILEIFNLSTPTAKRISVLKECDP